MNTNTVININKQTAEQTRTILLNAIGTENVPNQWQIFMRTVREELPFILSQGRPSREQISMSAIGALGFKSWKDFISAPVDEKGLNLSWSKWREWSRAWVVVSQRPELFESEYTPAEINRLSQVCKKRGIEFPQNPAYVESLKELLHEEKEEEKENSLQGLKEEVEKLKKNLASAEARESVYRSELHKRADETAELTLAKKELAEIKTVRENETAELANVSEELKKIKNELNNFKTMSFIQRLKFLTTGA